MCLGYVVCIHILFVAMMTSVEGTHYFVMTLHQHQAGCQVYDYASAKIYYNTQNTLIQLWKLSFVIISSMNHTYNVWVHMASYHSNYN